MAHPDLSVLPPELIDQIAQYLTPQDLAALNLANRGLHDATEHEMGDRQEALESLRNWMADEGQKLVNQLNDLPLDGTGLDDFLDTWEANIAARVAIDWDGYGPGTMEFLAEDIATYGEILADMIPENLLTKLGDVMDANQRARVDQIKNYALAQLRG